MMVPIPEGFPKALSRQNVADSVAAVVIHSNQASLANQHSTYRMVDLFQAGSHKGNPQELVGCGIFLPQLNLARSFSFGRARRNVNLDVFLPEAKAAMKQFTLIPDIKKDFWRVQSNSETIATVNDVPIQKHTTRTKKVGHNYPETIYLARDVPHHIRVKDLALTLWLLQSPSDFVQAGFIPTIPPLLETVQVVDDRDEDWARSQFIQAVEPVQVSANSVQVFNRFTGEFSTAKLFKRGRNGVARRDAEFLMMAKREVDRSVVRYIRTAIIGGIPSIITATHEGFASYATCHHNIAALHPGFRFRIASKLLRRLFQAVDFLHFNTVIHGNLSRESVLVRMAGPDVEKVLVVDYSSAWSFAAGEELPRRAMAADARAIMEIVEESCDLWTLRNGQPAHAARDKELRRRTAEASRTYGKVRRVAADFFEVQRGSRHSARGEKLQRLVQRKRAALWRARNEQIANATNRVILPVMEKKLNGMNKEWSQSHPGVQPPLILSLGHKYLDDLVNALFLRNWDLTPRQVCITLRMMEGECELPWRTFSVTRKFSIRMARSRCGSLHIRERDLAILLADIVGAHPREMDDIRFLYHQHIKPSLAGWCSPTHLANFMTEIRNRSLPPTVSDALAIIQGFDHEDTFEVERTTHIAYHIPSRMFNLTQLHRAADPATLRDCIHSNTVACNHFIEVRGEPELQGCYAPLDLLLAFANVLALNIVDQPTIPTIPTLDPADFSQVNLSGRTVLAHKGLVGYASMSRTTPQVTHCPKDVTDVSSTPSFLLTYFGNMNVLPYSSTGLFNHSPPSHWSKFHPLHPQPIQPLKRPFIKPTQSLSSTLETIISINHSLLSTSLEKRPGTPSSSAAKRSKPTPDSPPILARMDPRLYSSALNAENLHLLEDTTAHQDDDSFTVAASSVGLEEDRAVVERMMERMAESEEVIGAWTDFMFHGLEVEGEESLPSTDVVEWRDRGDEVEERM